MITKLTSNGRLTIPSEIRKKFGIKEGTRLQIEINEEENLITLKPITRGYVYRLHGKFKGKGLMKELMEKKRGEQSF